MEVEEKTVAEMLYEAAEKQRRYRVRAILITLIPVMAGLLFTAYFSYQVINLEKRARELRVEAAEDEARALVAKRQAEEAEMKAKDAEKSSYIAQRKADEALAKLHSAERALVSAERALVSIATGRGDPKRVAKQGLQRIGNETNVRPANKRWVVIGAHKSLEEARRREQEAKDLGYIDTAVYLRHKSYRTVIELQSESEARAAYRNIRKQLNKKAYLRDLDVWCPDMQNRDSYFVCQ